MADQKRWSWRRILLVAGLAVLSGCVGPVEAPAETRRTAEPEAVFAEVVELSNGQVTLIVSPAVGRVVHFGPADGRNLLWLASAEVLEAPLMRGDLAYFNYGGDKLWPTVQALWGRAFGGGNWPPDGVIDGEPWTVVERGARHVMLRSAVSPDLGVVAERRIELVEDRPAVHLRNRLTRVQRNPFPVHLWTVTQVQTPPAVMLDVAADRPAVQGLWDPFGKPQAFAPDNPQVLGEKAALYWQLNPGEHRKVGTFGRWVAGLYPDLIFLQQTTFDPQGAYPDRSSAQVYNDANLTELELLSPMVHLQPGQTLENHVVWQLLPGSAGERPDETLERITAAVAATALEPDRVIRHGAGGLGP